MKKSTRLLALFINSFGMILFRLVYFLLTLSVFFDCSLFKDKQIPGTKNSVHLVLNSTGYATEFCVFEVESYNLDCKSKKAKNYSKCVEYFPENTNYPTLSSKETLDQIYKGLADMELSRPILKNSIQSVGYIVTGSFKPDKDKGTKEVLKDVESFFFSENLKIITKSIPGEEEARLTLAAIQDSTEIKKTNNEIALLQIGSESVEVATSDSTKVASSKIGIQLILEELSNIKPGINACRQPISAFFKSEASSYEKCKSFIRDNLNKSQRISPLTKLKLDDSYQVYTTGSTWNYYYPNKEKVSIEELNKTGNEFCSLTIDQILKKGIKKKNAYNLCYSLAFKSVLAETLGIKKIQILQKEVYLKSLSSSSILFPEFCK